MSTKIPTKETVIVHSSTGEIVERCGDLPLIDALREYAEKIGADPAKIKSTNFGIRLTVPGEGDFRATYR